MAFPLSWRKFSLTALRVQEHPARNKRLAQELEILRAQVPNQVVIPGQDTFYNLDQLVASLALDRTRAQRLKTFLMQWGRFLTQLTRKNPELSEDEIILMLAPIQSVYRHYDVPFEGLPIGSEIVIRTKGTHPETLTTSFIVPPCTEDVFFEHWVSLHIRYYKGSIVSIPMLVNFSMPPGPCFGLGHYIEQCTLHRLQILMADLDYFKIDMVLRQVVLSDESESELIDWVTGFGPRRTVHSIYCIKEPPMWYNDIIADEGPE